LTPSPETETQDAAARAARRLRRRAVIVSQVRSFFEARDFLEVETPLLVPSPGLDVHLAAFEVPVGSGARFLSTSPEYQMKRLLADGHRRIFQIAKAFRKDERGDHHNPEFTMLEWYRAPSDVEDVMRDTEQLVAQVTGGAVVLEDASGAPGTSHDAEPPFRLVTVLQAFAAFAGSPPEETLAMAERDEDRFYRLLVDRVEPAIEAMRCAVFLTEYPATQASLARRKPGAPAVAERFELYLGGLELCNGFGELTDPGEQRARFEHDLRVRAARGLPAYPIDERFLEALRRGLPECAGNALGLDRLVALSCGTANIADVLALAADDV
jgi:lysyl-tRNA synthetase class 2